MLMSHYLKPGTLVRRANHPGDSWEDGVVVHCWREEKLGIFDCYVAFFGTAIPEGKPSEKPYVLRYASTSLTVMVSEASGDFVYIAASKDTSSSYVDVTQSLLAMEWIAKYGVDDLVWFEGFIDPKRAAQRVADLRSMTETDRRKLIQQHNPDGADLSPRIWGSDPE